MFGRGYETILCPYIGCTLMFTVFSNILGSTQLEVQLHTYLWSSTWTLLFIFLSYYHNYIHTCGAEIMHWVGNVDVFFLAVENVSI